MGLRNLDLIVRVEWSAGVREEWEKTGNLKLRMNNLG